MDYVRIIGQMFGIIAVVLGFLSFQMKTLRNLIIVQTAISLTFVIHYLLIGATSACVLNLVCTVRNFAYSNRDKKIFGSKLCPVAFAIIMGILGALSWQGWFSLFVVVGLIINTLCMAMKNPQNIRKSILVTSPMVIVYDIFADSYGGIIYESVAIISSIIGILRYKKRAEI